MMYVSDIVQNETKVIVKPDYRTMAKNFWLYPEKWREQDDARGENLVVGGEYTVWKVIDKAIYLQDKYKRYDRLDTIGINDLAMASELSPCNFDVGDMVKPSNTFDLESFKNELHTYFKKYFEGDNRYRVTAILNRYYMFINVSAGAEDSLPFYCGDFVHAREAQKIKRARLG